MGKIKELRMDRIAPLFLFMSALLWSMSGIFTKSVAWNGICIATLRGIIAFIVAAFLLRGKKITFGKKKVLTAICFFVQGTLFMCANKYTTAANATVLQNTSPLYIILFNALFEKRNPSKKECITCGCLFFGVILAFAGNIDPSGMFGNILALISALFYAGVFFLSKDKDAQPLESLFLGNGCYLFLLPVLLGNETVRNTGVSEWMFLLSFATLTGIGAWLFFAKGIRYTSALQANFITMSEPVMAPLWTFLFLCERISVLSIIGCSIVIATLLIYNISLVDKKAAIT